MLITDREQLVATPQLSSDVGSAARQNVRYVDSFSAFTSNDIEPKSWAALAYYHFPHFPVRKCIPSKLTIDKLQTPTIVVDCTRKKRLWLKNSRFVLSWNSPSNSTKSLTNCNFKDGFENQSQKRTHSCDMTDHLKWWRLHVCAHDDLPIYRCPGEFIYEDLYRPILQIFAVVSAASVSSCSAALWLFFYWLSYDQRSASSALSSPFTSKLCRSFESHTVHDGEDAWTTFC